MGRKAERIELLQGTLDTLILRTLFFGASHGHQIAKHIQRTTNVYIPARRASRIDPMVAFTIRVTRYAN